MTTEQIVQWVIAALPSVIAVLTTVGLIIRTLKDFKALKAQVADMKAVEDIRDQLKLLLQENYALKAQLNKTIAKLNKVKYDEKNQ